MLADNLQRPARMNLQLFADGGPTPVEPIVAQEEDVSFGSLEDFLNQYQGEEIQDGFPAPEYTPEPSAEEKLILGKFKSQDDLVTAYQEAERRISQYGQDTAQAKRELEQLRGQVSQLQQFMHKPQPEPTHEDIQAQNQKWLDKFYENPKEALDEVIQSRVQQIVEPIQRDYQLQQYARQYQTQVEEARQKYADFDTLQPVMQQIAQEQGQYLATLPNAVEIIYSIAKGRSATVPADPMSDEVFRQRILQDEGIRKAVLSQYAQEVKSKQPPVVIGTQAGEPPIAAPEEIRTTKDAKKASLAYFSQILKGGSR